MTVNATTNIVTYTGDGSSINFPVPFYFIAESHLTVTRITIATGARVLYVLNSDYVVTGAGNFSGGLVAFGTAPSALFRIEIKRVVPVTHATDYIANDPFGAETVERDFDYLTMICQQIDTRLAVLEAVPTSGSVQLANLGAGSGIYASQVGNVYNLKSLIAGTNIALVATGNDITINSSAGGLAYDGNKAHFLRGDGNFTDTIQDGPLVLQTSASQDTQQWYVTSAPLDQKRWTWRVSLPDTLALWTIDDSFVYTAKAFEFKRSGAALTTTTIGGRVLLGGAADDGVSSLRVSGSARLDTALAIAYGGTGATNAQAAINSLSAVAAATNEHVLTKDTASGNAKWKPSTQAHIYNVKSYGAVGDGITNDQVAINAAITALSIDPSPGVGLYFPAGTYMTPGGHLITRSGIRVFGDGALQSNLICTNATNDLLTIGDNVSLYTYVTVDRIRFDASVVKTAGVGLRMRKIYIGWVEQVQFQNQWFGWQLEACISVFAQSWKINQPAVSATSIGVQISGGQDHILESATIESPTGSRGGIGIDIPFSNSSVMSDVDVIGFTFGLRIKQINVGEAVDWCFFQQCLFDSCGTDGIYIEQTAADVNARVKGISFQNCWSSSNTRRGVYATKTGTGTLQGLVFDNFKCLANGENGIWINTPALQGFQLTDSQIAGNSAAFTNSFDGVTLDDGVSRIRVTGNTIGRFANASGSQRYGLNIDGATCDIITVIGNDFETNLTAQMRDASVTVNKTVENNTGLGAYDVPNMLRNPGMVVAQRPAVALVTSTFAIGKVDDWYGGNSAGVVTAGTITQDAAATVGRTGYALHLSGVSLTGAAIVNARHRLESRDSALYKNQTVSFQIRVLHDVGSAVNYTVIFRKANAQDNFGATTLVATSTAQSVPSGTSTLLRFEGVAVGDSSNGIEIEIQAAAGVVTTKNFRFTEAQLDVGALCKPYRYTSFDQDISRVCYYKTFPYATAPAQNAGTAGQFIYSALVAGASNHRFQIELPRVVRPGATFTITTYNTSAANANWRNSSLGADSGACTTAQEGERAIAMLNPQVAGDLVGHNLGIHLTADWNL